MDTVPGFVLPPYHLHLHNKPLSLPQHLYQIFSLCYAYKAYRGSTLSSRPTNQELSLYLYRALYIDSFNVNTILGSQNIGTKQCLKLLENISDRKFGDKSDVNTQATCND